jgi:hypothetical protein
MVRQVRSHEIHQELQLVSREQELERKSRNKILLYLHTSQKIEDDEEEEEEEEEGKRLGIWGGEQSKVVNRS